MPLRESLEDPQVGCIPVAGITGINYFEQHRFADVALGHAYSCMAGNYNNALKAVAKHDTLLMAGQAPMHNMPSLTQL